MQHKDLHLSPSVFVGERDMQSFRQVLAPAHEGRLKGCASVFSTQSSSDTTPGSVYRR